MSKPRKPPRWREEAEDALYNYPAIDDYIADMKAEIDTLLPQGTSSVIKFDHNSGNGGQRSSTEDYAIMRIVGEKAKKLEQAIDRKKRIGKALRRMTEEEREIVKFTYFDRWKDVDKDTKRRKDSLNDILTNMNISKSKYYRHRDNALRVVALHIGRFRHTQKVGTETELK